MADQETAVALPQLNSHHSESSPSKRKPEPQPPSDPELNRVRELILGEDSTQQRLGQSEVDRLREIIFGSHIEEYERRFADTRREQERILADLRLMQDSVGEFEKAQMKRFEGLQQELHRTSDELQHEMRRLNEQLRNREALLQQLLNQARQQEMMRQELTSNAKELHKAMAQQERDFKVFRTNVDDTRDQYERKLDALKQEVRQAEDDLRDELRRVTDRLDYQKTDRKALAAMLMEIATRLETGSTVTGLLEDLSNA